MVFEAQEPVAFDMGISTLQRINYELWHCNMARREKDMDAWWSALTNIYLEIDTFIKVEKEREEHQQKDKECEKVFQKLITYNKSFISNKNSKQPYSPPRETYDLFKEWELMLRKSMDKYGLLMRKGGELDN